MSKPPLSRIWQHRMSLTRRCLNKYPPIFPAITSAGVFPLSELDYGGAFKRLIEAIQGRDLEELLEEKFNMVLRDNPLMITVRGQCQKKDGRIHTDSKTKS